MNNLPKLNNPPKPKKDKNKGELQYLPPFISFKQSGHTLLELMVVCSIAAILALVSSTGMSALIRKQQSDSTIDALERAIYYARTTAINSKVIVSLCPFSNTGCGNDWSEGVIIFSDPNNNGKIDIDSNEVILEKLTLSLDKMNVSWRASGGKNYLRYSPTGMARQFGRFHLCHKNNDLSSARSLVINRQGRIRRYYDRDKDGIVEDIDGRIPEC